MFLEYARVKQAEIKHTTRQKRNSINAGDQWHQMSGIQQNEPWWTFTRPAPSQSIYSSKAWELMKRASRTQTATQTSDRTSAHLRDSLLRRRSLFCSCVVGLQLFLGTGLQPRWTHGPVSVLSFAEHPLPLKQHDKHSLTALKFML